MFIITIISAIILWRTYDALRALPQTESVSLWWHALSFAFMLVLSAFVYYHYFGFTWAGWQPALLTAVASWWLCDFVFNLVNKQSLFYAGDGHGSSLERVFTRLGNKVNFPLWVVLLLAKVLTTITTVLLVCYGKAFVAFITGIIN